MKTSGHLINNGGIRGHSAGDFYPYKVMAQGMISNLTWWTLAPNGSKIDSFSNPTDAVIFARLLFNRSANHDYANNG